MTTFQFVPLFSLWFSWCEVSLIFIGIVLCDLANMAKALTFNVREVQNKSVYSIDI